MSKEAMTLALKRAFQLGQDYWYQADHEFVSQNKKSDETRAKFEQLIDDTCQALAKQEQRSDSEHSGEPVAWTIDSLEQEIYENTRQFVSLNVMEWLLNRLNSTLQPAPQRSEDTTQKKPLTDEQIMDMYNEPRSDAEMLAFARAIEAAHGIKS